MKARALGTVLILTVIIGFLIVGILMIWPTENLVTNGSNYANPENGGKGGTVLQSSDDDKTPGKVGQNSIQIAKDILQSIRTSISAGKTPKTYLGFAADLAFLLFEQQEDDGLRQYLESMIKSDVEPRIRALVSIIYGMEGGNTAKKYISSHMFNENDPDVASAMLLAYRVGDPLRDPPLKDSDPWKHYLGPITKEVITELLAQLIFPLDEFYGHVDIVKKDFPSISENGGGSFVIESLLKSQFFDSAAWTYEIVETVFHYLHDGTRPVKAIKIASDILIFSHVEFPEEMVTEVVKSLQNVNLLADFSRSRVLTVVGAKLEEPAFQLHWKEIANVAFSGAGSNNFLWQTVVDKYGTNPERYFDIRNMMDSSMTSGFSSKDVQIARDKLSWKMLQAAPGTDAEEKSVAIVQRTILEEYKLANPDVYCRLLGQTKIPLDGFVIQEARGLLPAISDSERAQDLLQAFARFGTESDVNFLESMTFQNQANEKARQFAVRKIRSRNEKR